MGKSGSWVQGTIDPAARSGPWWTIGSADTQRAGAVGLGSSPTKDEEEERNEAESVRDSPGLER
jgi:hypothetical protein